MTNKYLITLKKWSDDIYGTYFVARVPELDGCMSNGETIKEALSNIREAIQGYVEVKQEYGDYIPTPINSKEIVQLLGEYTQDEIKECYAAVEKFRTIINKIK